MLLLLASLILYQHCQAQATVRQNIHSIETERLMKVIFFKVFLEDSNRQPQPSRENPECYPYTNPFKSNRLGWK